MPGHTQSGLSLMANSFTVWSAAPAGGTLSRARAHDLFLRPRRDYRESWTSPTIVRWLTRYLKLHDQVTLRVSPQHKSVVADASESEFPVKR